MGGKSRRQTVGYRYFMGLQFGICYGPVDALKKILIGERIAWQGERTSSGSVVIDKPDLFGGDEREGGVQGVVGVLMGADNQEPNAYLQSQLGSQIPAYRGILSAILNGPSSGGNPKNGYIASNNPYVKPWAFEVKRILKGWTCSGSQGGTAAEYENEVMFPWTFEAGSPENCKNDHEYRAWSSSGSQVVELSPGSYRATLSEAIADAQAQIDAQISGYTLEGPHGYINGNSSTATLYRPGGFGAEADYEHLAFVYAINTIDTEILSLPNTVSTDNQASVYLLNTLQDDQTALVRFIREDGASPSGSRGGGVWLIKKSAFNNLGNPWTGYANSGNLGVPGPTRYLHSSNLYFLQIRRKVRAPDNPCEPRCEEPFPADPNSANYCIIGDESVYSGPWSLAAGTYRALSLYSVSAGFVQNYPLGPVVPATDPRYGDADFWNAEYAAAVAAGTMPAGKTYNSAGNGGINSYPRNLSSAYTRTPDGGATSGDAWYPEKAEVGDGDMNPAHIIYQCITDTNWGMGYPVASIDDANFRAVADALFDETFGLSLLWNQQEELGTFIGRVLDHIGAMFFADPSTGKFKLRLIRDDYDPETLEVFDPSNVISLDSFQRAGFGETVNEVTVVYRDRATNKDTPITVQDLANIQAQGGVVSRTTQYPGISNATLAGRVAERDLLASSTPLSKVRMTVNRSAWAKVPGDVVKLDWPKLGLSGVIYRVIAVNSGSLTDGKIVVDMAEDVFGLPDSTYAAQEPAEWIEPDTSPALITLQDVFEIPYYPIATTLSAADFEQIDSDSGFVGTLASTPGGLAQSYRIHTRVGSAAFSATADPATFNPSLEADGAITPDQTVIPFASPIAIGEIVAGDLALIGSGADAEFVELVSISPSQGTVTVSRGLLDTTPRDHADGTRIWIVPNFGFDETERATGETVDVRLTTIATGGELDVNLATTMQVTMAQRFFRPYPPGNVRINGQSFPSEISEALTISWAHRDRTQQTADLIQQSEGSIGPEPGTVYNAYLYDDDSNSLLLAAYGLIATTWSPSFEGPVNVRLEIESQRDGVVSWQRQVRRFSYTFLDSSRLLEDGGFRLLESGDARLMESAAAQTPNYPFSAEVRFSGSVSSQEVIWLLISSAQGYFKFEIEGTGKSAVSDFATDAAAQIAAENIAGIFAYADGDSLFVTSNAVVGVDVSSFEDGDVMTETLVKGRPISGAQPSYSYIDLYQISGSSLVLSPSASSLYRNGGLYSISYYVTENGDSAFDAHNPQVFAGSSFVSVPSLGSGGDVSYSLGLAGIADAINADANLQSLGISASFSGFSGSPMLRNAIVVSSPDGYVFRLMPDVFLPAGYSVAPSGYVLDGRSIQAGSIAYPDGVPYRASVGLSLFVGLPNLELDRQFVVILNDTEYVYTVESGDAGAAPGSWSGIVFPALAALIDAEADFEADGSTGTLSIEHVDANVPFTLRALTSFGLRWQVFYTP
jgi:hypothetical protein